ncbi:hypothetical protein RT41_GL001143 [Lactococcus fujiensis JCM 16395]|uniref:Uncharacterized protein n=1 Tax=Lactococcus fujiensis JCM 16395 TaxID=1291764 RepID=A0A2A5RN54_9LACT|nr:hypothetical protein RT41_GL001143 [Lactococcus fujiensis JCM 16395]
MRIQTIDVILKPFKAIIIVAGRVEKITILETRSPSVCFKTPTFLRKKARRIVSRKLTAFTIILVIYYQFLRVGRIANKNLSILTDFY